VAALLAATESGAAPCGDDVGGVRIACHCGDTVVSSTTLRDGDPVVSTACPIDGLTIRADALAETVTLDLGGLSLVGSGAGVGLRVDYGGADGAAIVGGPSGARGTIRRFGIGVSTSAGDAIASISRLTVRDNRHEGMRIVVAGTVLDNVVATANGDDGLHVRGSGGRLTGVESSSNGGRGILLSSNGAAFDAIANGNGDAGVVASGARNDLSNVSTSGNARSGIVVRGQSMLPAQERSSGDLSEAVKLNGARLEP
jgi:hypothetical protein